MSLALHTQRNTVIEWGYAGRSAHADPFNEVELDVLLTHEGGRQWRVPAYWAGGQNWRVRFAPPLEGSYRFTTVCSDAADAGLHGQEGTVVAGPYTGSNPLLQHGALRIGAGGRHFEHEDGTPFLWLGDTWWMGLAGRWRWPEDIQLMADDRQRQGFNVVQIVAGLYPDQPAFDPRGENEAGYAWEKDWARINPAYFDMADLRIRWLVRSGIVPCVVGAWGYYLPWLGVERMKRHWRYLVARWGAYPAFWCLSGEQLMPWYLTADREGDRRLLKQGWTEVARYVRAVDPYHHLLTCHTAWCEDSRDEVEDHTLMDFSLVQGGNSGYHAQEETAAAINAAIARTPRIPVVQGETCYENNQSTNTPDMIRFCYWSTALSGVAGYSYGADGIWQINTREKIYGASPFGISWGDTPWEDAVHNPGARQLALGKKLLAGLPWWRMEPHQEWPEPAAGPEKRIACYAAGVPGELRVIFYPIMHLWGTGSVIHALEPGARYQASYWDPRNGAEHPIGTAEAGPDGDWRLPAPPVTHDWVVVLKRIP